VLVGGKGKRLRPLSTDERPKAFLSVTRSGKSMFADTVRRINGLIPASRIIVVANRAHKRLVTRDLPWLKGRNLILEPVSRNTAPAVGLAARAIEARHSGAIMAVLPTDHYVRDEGKYAVCLKTAVDFLKSHKDCVVVFGIKPTYPSTEYGYIKLAGGRYKSGKRKVSKAEKFVEKPALGKAVKYLKSGSYLWNSGTFLFASDTLLRLMKKLAPGIYRNLKRGAVSAKVYSDMPDISLDYAVMEKAGNIYCVRGDYGWSDVGSFEALKRVLRAQGRKFAEENGKITEIY